MECTECEDTLCEELYKDEDTYCCICYEVEPESMCYECHTDYISTQADMYQDMVEDHIIHTEFDN